MITINLTDAEQELLQQILTSALANMDVEIRRTDHLEFKEVLKQRRNVLNEILEKVQVPTLFSP